MVAGDGLPPFADVDWSVSHRIIRTIYPPVWLFEDIADPADWDLIASAEAKTNPRVRDQIGDLSLVPVERRVSGPTSSLAMAAFTHVSRDRPGRFSDGSYGVWYCGDRFEVALAETAHHFERFMARTNEPPADAQYRELTAHIAGSLHDFRNGGFDDCLKPDDWIPEAKELSIQVCVGRPGRRSGCSGRTLSTFPSFRRERFSTTGMAPG